MTGERTVAFIGDSTFYHSGLPALTNAVKARDDVTVVILDNYITAMTGFQPSLTTDHHGSRRRVETQSPEEPESPPLSIEESVRGVGVEEIYPVDPFDEAGTLDALRKAKGGSGVNVVICHAPCVVDQRRLTGRKKQAPCAIDQDLCNVCSLCVRLLGCPAIIAKDGRYLIDPDLCDGCELCVLTCNHDAIYHPVSTRV
jgi:indolepyruvate ferredoxin oxidoreductase alpha subunit